MSLCVLKVWKNNRPYPYFFEDMWKTKVAVDPPLNPQSHGNLTQFESAG